MSWKHLEDFYLQDKRNVIRMAPKLTERHIHLPPFTNMSVKLATQVFSHSVAAGKLCAKKHHTHTHTQIMTLQYTRKPGLDNIQTKSLSQPLEGWPWLNECAISRYPLT